MPFITSFNYKMMDSTSTMNSHFLGINAPGIYEGFVPTPIANSMSVIFSPGAILDKYGKLIKSTDSQSVSIDPSSSSVNDRIDLVHLRYVHYPDSPEVSIPVIMVMKGMPSKVPSTPVIDETFSTILAKVRVRAGATELKQSDLQAAERVYTNLTLRTEIEEPTFHELFGHRKLEGLVLSLANDTVSVSAGRALIGGRLQGIAQATTLSVPAYRTNLKSVSANNIASVVPDFQPSIATRIRVSVTLSGTCASGNATVIGKDHTGAQASENVSLKSTGSTDTLFIFETLKYFTSISSVQLAAYDAGIRRTKVDIDCINETFYYLQRHGFYTNSPIVTANKPIDTSTTLEYMLLGSISMTSKLVNGVPVVDTTTVQSTGTTVLKAVSSQINNIVFSGPTGTVIQHNLGVSPSNYSVSYAVLAQNFEEAAGVGNVWFKKETNKLTVYNSGKVHCNCEVTISVREN